MTRPCPRGTAALAAVVCCAALFAGPAAAALYKWTDASGRVIYSDQPPPDRKVEKIVKPVPAADPAAARELQKSEEALRERQRERGEEAAKAEKQAVDAKKREELCKQLRGDLDTLRNNVYIYRVEDKGEKVLLSEDDRRKTIAEREKMIKERCTP
jgi:Skp family chaperone for outer membrane proteins